MVDERRSFIPVNEPLLGGNEKAYLAEAIDSGWISSEGPQVRRFEETFSSVVGRRYGIAVTNGTAALEVALAALRIGPGDEVILPTFTIISCAAAVVRAGAVPVLVDSDALTWNMDVRRIEERITPRTRAIMAVHTYGLPVDMVAVQEIACRYGLWVIEDAAEAHGLTCHGKPCGSFGDISTFSFYPNKLVTTGEGGMVVTDNEETAERCRSLRNLCFQNGRRFVHEELGWNYRMTSLQAALGIAQLERMEEFRRLKRRMGELYTAELEGLPVQLPPRQIRQGENGYWVFGVVLNDEVPADAVTVMALLQEKGVGTRPFFWSMHEQPVFREMGFFTEETYPVAERLARRGFYLPSGLGTPETDFLRAADALRGVFRSLG